MTTRCIDIIAGARPNFMKIAPIIQALQKHKQNGGSLRFRLVHTGQHYDARMSGDFFTQLGIPAPDVNLEVGSGSQAAQTGAIMLGYERLLVSQPSDLCLVVGDVTSTMACAISAQKLGIPVAHVEAGIRSGDWTMPEEINRMVTDAISNWFFTTGTIANQNLRDAGVKEEHIFFVGNTMIDTLLQNMDRFSKPDFWDAENLAHGEYLVLTLHRPSNVDAIHKFAQLVHAVAVESGDKKVVFPVHPRTAKSILDIGKLPGNVRPVEPQPYLQFNYLVKHACAVITDSGGITEEATVMGVPCMTLRDSTERPETVTIGSNELLGTDPKALKPAMQRLFEGRWKKGAIPERWDGRAGERIVVALDQLLAVK